jgi:hypothetical protein
MAITYDQMHGRTVRWYSIIYIPVKNFLILVILFWLICIRLNDLTHIYYKIENEYSMNREYIIVIK